MQIIRTANYDEMSVRAAGIICAQVTLDPASVLGLATGSTPVGAYAKLIEWHKAGLLDFSRCSTVNLDEYAGLQPENNQSYAYFMRENFFGGVNFAPSALNIPNGMAADGAVECGRYEEVIRGLGGIDLQLLGIGHNGHIGFNEPDDYFETDTHMVALTESTIKANSRFFGPGEHVPTHAYTMGMGAIMRARRILLVASGKEKAGILKTALTGPVTPKVPASILKLHPNVTVVADEAALSNM